jgi:glycosyltransferase involved in cell wall biosynthesis
MARGRRINVVYSDNGSGLSRDAWVVRSALERAGHRVWLTRRPPRRFPIALNYAPELAQQILRDGTQRVVRAWAKRTHLWDVNIFLDRLVPDYFDCARMNCLVPNQEWLPPEDRCLLKDIDLVLFKTRHAMSLLQREAKQSEYVGFTSLDRRDRRTGRRAPAALHICGWNPHKGTDAVVGAWAKHPEWPELTVVTQLQTLPPANANVTRLTSRVSDVQLRHLQNGCAVHVCPSEVEGFGHTLMEAMSCGAVLITTDAPPMDELVLPDEGILVPHSRTAPMGAGTRYMVDERRLAETIASVWRMDTPLIERFRRAARAKFEASQACFHHGLARAIQGM